MFYPLRTLPLAVLHLLGAVLLVPRVAAQDGTGRISGRVLDQGTGRPLVSARVMVGGIAGAVETDLSGRFRTPPLAAGVYTVRAALIGYKPVAVARITVPGRGRYSVRVAHAFIPRDEPGQGLPRPVFEDVASIGDGDR